MPGLHVVRDIRDVHAQPVVAVRQALDRNRVVEVAGVLAVDGDDDAVAEVGAAGDVLLRAPAAPIRSASAITSGGCSSGMACLRRMISVSTPGSSIAPSTSVTTPRGRVAGRAMARDLDQHHLAGFGARRVRARDEDVVDGAPIERHDVGLTGAVPLEAADGVLQQRPRLVGHALLAAARKGVEVTAHQDQDAFVEQGAQVPLGGRSIEARDAQDADDFVRAGRVRQALPEAGKELGLTHGFTSSI